MVAGLEALLASFGLPLVTLACFVEGDGAAMVSGALSHRGYFPFLGAALAAALGAFLSDQLWFRVGRRVGGGAWGQRQLDRPAPARVRAWLLRRPNLAVVGFRFVWGIRVAGPMVIGAAVCVLGALVSQRLAPETTGHTLTRTSAVVGRSPGGAAPAPA